MAAQDRHGEISGVQRTHYCGAYWRWGFHEDGVASALRARRRRLRGARAAARELRSTRAGSRTGACAGRRTRFRYRVFMAYLDLDELPERIGPRWLWSTPHPALVRFRRADYLGDPDIPLADAVRALVAERTGTRPGGPVRLLTNLRCLGHLFNPVSFYYCFDRAGEGAAGGRRRGHQHAVGRAPRLRAGRAQRGRRRARARRQGLPRLAVHGHGPRVRAGA